MEPILPILLVVMVTIAAYGISKYDVLSLLVTPDTQEEPAPRTLTEFRQEYFTENALPDVQQANTPEALTPETGTYIEIRGGCGPHYEGTCVNGRGSASTSSPSVLKLRDGIVLRTEGTIDDGSGTEWHKVIFDEWVRYPGRIASPFYVAASFTVPHVVELPHSLESGTTTTLKRILIDRSEQRLTAYEENGDVFMSERISTGRDATPTPRGTFTIFRKTPSRYMQGPLPGISNDYYDLPGVPWNLYFTEQGGAIHGAYWHDKFGQQWSHGCVNLPVEKARELYLWADLGTQVVIRD
jgi:hypothetical protein